MKSKIKEILFQVSANVCIICAGFVFTMFAHQNCLANTQVKDTLAVIGKKTITSEEFIKSYQEKIRQAGLTDRYESRNKYLQNLVADELLIAYAKSKGLAATEEANKNLKRIKIQELLNLFSAKYISPQIDLTEDELKSIYVKLNTKIKVSHIYAPTRIKADSLFDELKSGKSFEDLASNNFDDPKLKDNGGLLGYISLDEMDGEFEKAAFSMMPGVISKPVKTVQGYSIIRVEDIKANPLLTESEYLKARDRIKAFARKRAYENTAKEFTSSLKEQLKTKVDESLLDKIFPLFKNKNLVDLIENSSGLSKKDLNKIIVYKQNGNWSLQKLFDEFNIVTEKQIRWVSSKENLEDFIYGLVNRDYIVQSAIKEKMDSSPEFKKNVEFNFDSYLLTSIENQLKRDIKISPDSIKTYYKENVSYFMTEPQIRLSSILLENSETKDAVKEKLENGELFEKLAEKYSIQSATAKSGGDMGFFYEKDLEYLAEKVFGLKKGEWAGPFEDNDKYLFLKCTNHKNSELIPFEKVTTQIEETLISLNWFELREQHVQKLKKEIYYKLFPEKLNKIIL